MNPKAGHKKPVINKHKGRMKCMSMEGTAFKAKQLEHKVKFILKGPISTRRPLIRGRKEGRKTLFGMTPI